MNTDKSPKTSICPQRKLIFSLFSQLLNSKKRLQLDDSLNSSYQEYGFNPEQIAFTTHFAYSLCRYWYGLDETILGLSHKKPKLERKVEILIKMGLLSLSDVISIPDYAAVDEILKLAKAQKLSKPAQGFIHALLQNYIKQNKPSVMAKLPLWLNKKLVNDIGKTNTQLYLEAIESQLKGVGIRINTLKTTVGDYTQALKERNIEFETIENQEPWLFLPEPPAIQSLPGYLEGWFIPQSHTAYKVTTFINVEQNQNILEIGSAPGGKTTHLAQLLNNTGSITALEVSPERIKKLEANLNRMGITNTLCRQIDLSKAENLNLFKDTQFDAILIDAPCSASGIIHKHPDILLQLTEEKCKKNQQTQFNLLKNAFKLLKATGQLLYVTCSVINLENNDVCELFESNFKGAISSMETQQLMPNKKDDGFFVLKVIKS